MGMELKVAFPQDRVPPWAAVSKRLAAAGFAVQMRMIDGELAFPDETPPDAWREIRVAFGSDMVTLRRVADGVHVVGWGNMTDAAQRLWRAAADALAQAGDGQVS